MEVSAPVPKRKLLLAKTHAGAVHPFVPTVSIAVAPIIDKIIGAIERNNPIFL